MPNVRITDLPVATLPLVGTEVFEISQEGLSRKVPASAILSSISSPLVIRADIDTADPPVSSETPTALLRYEDLDGSVILASLGFNADSTMDLLNIMQGGSVEIRATDTAGDIQTLLSLNPDGGSTLSSPNGSVFLKPESAFGVEAISSAGVFLGYAGNIKLETVLTGAEIRGSSANDPTAGGAQLTLLGLANATGDLIGQINWATAAAMNVENLVYGGDVQIRATDAGGTIRSLLVGDPDGETQLFYDGGLTFRLADFGVAEIRGNSSADADDRLLRLVNSTNTARAEIGHDGTSTLVVRSLINGAPISLEGNDGGGSLQSILAGDPDGAVTLYNAGVAVARTVAAGSGGLETNNTNTGVGFERVLTTSDLSSGVSALYFGGDPKVIAQGLGGIIRGSSAFDGDPTLGGDQDTILDLQNYSGDIVGSLWYDQVPDLTLENYVEGGRVELWGQETGGGGVPMIVANPDAEVALYFNSVISLDTRNDGAQLYGSVSPGVGGVQDSHLLFLQGDGTNVGEVGFNSSEDLRLSSYNHGGRLILQGEDSGGTNRTVFVGDPDGDATLYENGSVRLLVTSLGAVLRRDGNTDAENSFLQFQYLNGTERGHLGYLGNGSLDLKNLVHSGEVLIRGENGAGGTVSMIEADPNDDVKLFDTGSEVARTLPAASGGFQANNTLTGAGFERVLTTGDISTVLNFTPTFTGFSAAPAVPVVRYMVVGDMVFVMFDFSTGTSNATTFTINNIPAAIRPSLAQVIYIPSAIDNTANVAGCTVRLQAASASWLFGMGHNNPSGGGWTNSGSKGLGTSDGFVASYFLNHA